MRPTFLRVLGAIVLVVVLGLASLFLVSFDSPAMGRAVLARVSAASGAEITAESFRLGLLRGLSLGKVRVLGTFEGGRVGLDMDRLILEHRLLPLLHGEVWVERIVLDRPVAVVEEGGTAARRSAPAGVMGEAGPSLALHVSEIRVRDGSLTLKQRGSAPARVEGVAVTLRDLAFDPSETGLSGLSGQGQARVDAIQFDTLDVMDAEGRLRMAKGRVEVSDVRFRTPEGRFQGRFSLDPTRLPFRYSLSLNGDPLDVNALAGASGSGGFGPGRIDLDARGAGTTPAGLAGHGTLRLEAGTLPSTPLLRQVDGLLGGTRLIGTPYGAGETAFRIAHGRVTLDGLSLDSERVGVTVGGWTGLDGTLGLELAVRTPRKGIVLPGVPAQALDALTDDGGFVVLPFRVTGTQEKPRVRPDAAALLARARRSGARGLMKKLGSRLEGLFGKKDH